MRDLLPRGMIISVYQSYPFVKIHAPQIYQGTSESFVTRGRQKVARANAPIQLLPEVNGIMVGFIIDIIGM